MRVASDNQIGFDERGGLLCIGFTGRRRCLQVSFITKSAAQKDVERQFDARELSAHLALRYAGQVLTVGQQLTFEFQVRCRFAAAVL